MTKNHAKVCWLGTSQAVRLPKGFRLETDTVLVRRDGASIVLEPTDTWPKGYVASFSGVPDDFVRQVQGSKDRRRTLG